MVSALLFDLDMTKYIDADLLQEKITEQMESLPREVGRGVGTITSKGYGMMQAFQIMRSIIDSLQQEQPEVDLEKEIDLEWEKCDPIDEGMGLESANIVNEQFGYIARYFYNLGINARKEE